MSRRKPSPPKPPEPKSKNVPEWFIQLVGILFFLLAFCTIGWWPVSHIIIGSIALTLIFIWLRWYEEIYIIVALLLHKMDKKRPTKYCNDGRTDEKR